MQHAIQNLRHELSGASIGHSQAVARVKDATRQLERCSFVAKRRKSDELTGAHNHVTMWEEKIK